MYSSEFVLTIQVRLNSLGTLSKLCSLDPIQSGKLLDTSLRFVGGAKRQVDRPAVPIWSQKGHFAARKAPNHLPDALHDSEHDHRRMFPEPFRAENLEVASLLL